LKASWTEFIFRENREEKIDFVGNAICPDCRVAGPARIDLLTPA